MKAPASRMALGAAESACTFLGAPVGVVALFCADPTLARFAVVGYADLETPKRDDGGDWAD